MLKSVSINIAALIIAILIHGGYSIPQENLRINEYDDVSDSDDASGQYAGTKRVQNETNGESFDEYIKDVIEDKNKMEKVGLVLNMQGKVDPKKTKEIENKVTSKTSEIEGAVKKGKAILEAGKGIKTMVDGIKKGAWIEVVTGGLDIIASILSLMGPKAQLAGEILSIFSMIFSFFGGATGGQESTESMMTRVIDKALADAKVEELQSEANGVKRLFQSFTSSIANFREKGNITQDQAMEFYDQGFRGVRTFGVLEHYIRKWCSVGDANAYNDQLKKKKLNDKTSRCLTLVNLYCDLSIFRQIMLTDMSSLMAEANINGSAETFMYLIRREQEFDKNFLKFFMDPINHRDKRFVVNEYFSSISKYPTITTYLKNLLASARQLSDNKTEVAQQKKLYEKKFVMVCNDIQLKGDCFEFNFTSDMPTGWKNKIASLYVSDGVMVAAHHQSGPHFGPYYGPSVYSKVSGKLWDTITVHASQTNALDLVRICEKENMDTEGECMTLNTQEYWNFGDYTRYNKGKWIGRRIDKGRIWIDEIKSMDIPKGLEVIGFEERNFKGNVYGPYYGPFTISTVHPSAKWNSMRIMETSETTTNMVQICSEEGLKGYCDFVGPRKNFLMSKFHGIDWDKDVRLKSMKIPGGFTVKLSTNFDPSLGAQMGPYEGPSIIAKVDGADGDNKIKSISVEKIY